MTGLGSFCLVTREEIPNGIRSMFNFADLDRDGMMDMFYVNQQADANGIGLTVHYNALKNADAYRERNKLVGVEDALFTISNVCSPPNRNVTTLRDIYLPPNKI